MGETPLQGEGEKEEEKYHAGIGMVWKKERKKERKKEKEEKRKKKNHAGIGMVWYFTRKETI